MSDDDNVIPITGRIGGPKKKPAKATPKAKKKAGPRGGSCVELTAKGTRCRNPPVPGLAVCRAHTGTPGFGRKTKLSVELAETIAARVREGLFNDNVANLVGIHRTTLYAWLERGEADLENAEPTVFAYLSDSFTRARDEAERDMVRRIRGQSYVDWRAAAWWLERKVPERWSKREKIDVELNEISAPREVAPRDEEKRTTILGILAAATRPPAGLDTQE